MSNLLDRDRQMSILIVNVVDNGIIFAADRAITLGSKQVANKPKVLFSPNKRAIVGYCGLAEIEGQDMDKWLNHFLLSNEDFVSLKELSMELKFHIDKQIRSDFGDGNPEGLIIHVGGYERREEHIVPFVWYIRNVHGIDKRTGEYTNFDKDFTCSEEFWKYFPNIGAKDIRNYLKAMAGEIEPFWFHQALGLIRFNVFSKFLKEAFKLLHQFLPDEIPSTLSDWEKLAKMQVLMYGAYFEAFHKEGERYVGGGCDVVSLPWPSD
ncbi:MAG: hypothetical protein ABIH04_00145 [Planctomycetota bacterium]